MILNKECVALIDQVITNRMILGVILFLGVVYISYSQSYPTDFDDIIFLDFIALVICFGLVFFDD